MNTGRFTDFCRETGGTVNQNRHRRQDLTCEFDDGSRLMVESASHGFMDETLEVKVKTDVGGNTLVFSTSIDELEGGGNDGYLEMEGENFEADLY